MANVVGHREHQKLLAPARLILPYRRVTGLRTRGVNLVNLYHIHIFMVPLILV